MHGEHKMGPVGWITFILVIVGGLNWGLIAINPEWNLVAKLFGDWPVVERVVYGLVGVAALWMLVWCFMGCSKKSE